MLMVTSPDTCGSLLPASLNSPGASDSSSMVLEVCPPSSPCFGSPLDSVEPPPLVPLPELAVSPTVRVEVQSSLPRLLAGLSPFVATPTYESRLPNERVP
ncbi:hypothetical protein D1007_52402 [Hordeum vulgare]|nr:hypothetical protein D1007_52402 [Hordeum vulgare]